MDMRSHRFTPAARLYARRTNRMPAYVEGHEDDEHLVGNVHAPNAESS